MAAASAPEPPAIPAKDAGILHVMARTAVVRVSREDAVRRLGVTVLMAGKLRRNSEGRLVLDSELSNANGTVLRSSQYMADESDLPSVQADIVQDVIDGLGIELDARQSAGAQKPLTSSPAAFQAFLRGESAARDLSPQGHHAAIRNYEEAVRQDAKFALAYASMAYFSASTMSPRAITCPLRVNTLSTPWRLIHRCAKRMARWA